MCINSSETQPNDVSNLARDFPHMLISLRNGMAETETRMFPQEYTAERISMVLEHMEGEKTYICIGSQIYRSQEEIKAILASVS